MPPFSRAKWITKPSGLSPEAAEIWRVYAQGLHDAGHLTPETAENFRLLCEILAMARVAAREIAQHGATVLTKSGARRPNPACGTLLAAQKAVAPLLHDFGLRENGFGI